MAAPKSVYFPPLEACSKGEIQLLSWKEVCAAIEQHALQLRQYHLQHVVQSKAASPIPQLETLVEDFLSDDIALKALLLPLQPFDSPGPESRGKLDSLTSAINTTSGGSNGLYNIQQIRDDSLWLSNETQISETSALRLVLLEWQTRARSLLLFSTCTASDQTSNTTANSFRASSFLASTRTLHDFSSEPALHDGSFDTEQSRHGRQLHLLLSERLAVLRTADVLIRCYAEGIALPHLLTSDGHQAIFSQVAQRCVRQVCKLDIAQSTEDACLFDLFHALGHRITQLQTQHGGPAMLAANPDLEEAWIQTQVEEVATILQLAYILVNHLTPAERSVASFLDLMVASKFMDLNVSVPLGSSLDKAHTLSSLIAASFFSITSPTRPELSSPFLHDINGHMTTFSRLSNPLASIPIYAWIIFALDLSENSSHDEEANHQSLVDEDRLKSLANVAVGEMQLFSIISRVAAALADLYTAGQHSSLLNHARCFLLEVLTISMERRLIVYGEPVMWALLAILNSDKPYWDSSQRTVLDDITTSSPAADYLHYWIDYAKNRFPLETQTFMKLLKALLNTGSDAAETWGLFSPYLLRSDVFTDTLNPSFKHYEEAESATVDKILQHLPLESARYFIELQSILPLFVPANHQALNSHRKPSTALVLADSSHWQPDNGIIQLTVGEVMTDQSSTKIVSWRYDYSPLNFLVDWLATASPTCPFVPYNCLTPPTAEEVCDVIALVTTILQTLRQASPGQLNSTQLAMDILTQLPEYIDYDRDLVSIISELFETALQQYREGSAHDKSVEYLSKCIEFFHVSSFFVPTRVWPLLARSSLLDLNGSNPTLVIIVSKVEMVQGDYLFLLSCVKLFERLLDLSFVQEFPEPAPSSKKTLTRLANGNEDFNKLQSLPSKTTRSIVITYLRILISVFENSQFWSFSSRKQRASVNISLMSSFQKILRLTYGFTVLQSTEQPAVNLLTEPAKILVDQFLSASSASSVGTALVTILSSPLSESELDQDHSNGELQVEKRTALLLSTTILRVAAATRCFDSNLQVQMYQLAPVLARLFTLTASLQIASADAIDALLSLSLRQDTQPPSLLGYMGTITANAFLVVLSRLNGCVRTINARQKFWNFLSTIVSSHQQWFALYLLTGNAPRGTMKEEARKNLSLGCPGQSVLNHALDHLSGFFRQKPTSVTTGPDKLIIPLAMLDFVSKSYDHWPGAVSAIQAHTEFVDAMINHFAHLSRDDLSVSQMTWQSLLAAATAELLAMLVHTARRRGNVETALRLVNKLRYVKNHAFKAPDYNHSLHSLLRQNISTVCPGLDLSSFQHTLVFPTEYGENYFYDVTLATSIIRAKRNTVRLAQNPDFSTDLESANLDLSRLNSQLQLNKKARLLVIELAHVLPKDPQMRLVDPLLDLTKDCLTNLRATMLPSSIIEPLEDRQIDLALTILRNLVTLSTTAKQKDLIELFPVIWTSLSSIITDFDGLYMEKTADLNKRLLQILFLSLQPLARFSVTAQDVGSSVKSTSTNRLSPAILKNLLEVVSEVVTKGFVNLSNIVHEDCNQCSPADFGLVTAIFQSILAVPGINALHGQIAVQLQTSDALRYALSLFSWSDQLLVDGDPIYGEHSILFLLEMSSVASMAEYMAISGVLTQLSSANIMKLYNRPGGSGSFDLPVQAHSIWVRGILPLCLNLLSAVGGPVAAEIASFLGQFDPQVARLIKAMSNRYAPIGTRAGLSHLTLNMAAEVHSLSLMSAILNNVRVIGAASVGSSISDALQMPPSWDQQNLKDDVDEWIAARALKSDWVFPANDRDVNLAAMRTSLPGSHSHSRLEEKVWSELEGAQQCLKDSTAT